MKEILTKKLLIIVSVVSFVVLGAVILALTVGNSYYPGLSDPDGVFYQRVDDSGNVIYTVTNQDVYEKIKSNDGIKQLLYMVDSVLISQYIDQVTQDQIDNKILELTYGTSDPDEIAKIDDATKTQDETSFQQSMIIAGFENNHDEYAKMLVARELYARATNDENGTIGESDVAKAFLNSYFSDISAISVRFTSQADATDVLRQFNVLSLDGNTLRAYNGYTYKHEDLVRYDDENTIVDAYITVDTYYFDADGNIVNSFGDIVYTKGANDIYTDTNNSDKQYVFVTTVGLQQVDTSNTIISADVIFQTEEEAIQYRNDNTQYFTVSKTDPFDDQENAVVKNADGVTVYTIDGDGHIWDMENNDVTYTTDLYVNKEYTSIDNVTTATENNTSEMTDAEVLAVYVDMYNYVYGNYRDALPAGLTADQYAALGNDNLSFNFDTVNTNNSSLATYMFDTLSIANGEFYTGAAQKISYSNTDYYYMVYKLTEGTKTDLMDTIWSYVEPTIVIPTTIGDSITLPTTTYYNGTITWDSSNKTVISNLGTVTKPAEDTEVNLTYKLTILGKSTTGTIAVTVLANGTTETVTASTWEEIPLKTLINDDTVYDQLYNQLLDDYIYGSSGQTNVNSAMIQLRTDMGFQIFDHFVAIDYQGIDKNFVGNKKGDKTILASLDKTLTSDTPVTFTADAFFEYTMSRNPALYGLYTAQYDELINSDYFTNVFGTQTDLKKNDSAYMSVMYSSISQEKQRYAYLQQVYAQYGMTFSYTTFIDYAYSQYGTKSELELLQYFVQGKLQPFFINETINAKDLLNQIYPTVEDYYNNYFSLNVTHVLAYLDFNEDGTPDNYDDYIASLSADELTAFNTLVAHLEQKINEYEGTFSQLITDYNNATREDATWGEFKQNGFFLLTEDLNIVDSKDSTVTHSLTYSGTYGVKDKFDPAFVQALVDMYDEYQLPINQDATQLYSNALVASAFGLHYIKVTKGDDFEKPTAQFTEADANNPQYSVGVENANGMPTMEQIQLYAQYKLYSMVYDLSNADVESTYGITVPKLPTSVSDALAVYVGNQLDGAYVIGTLNVDMASRMTTGEFVSGNTYCTFTNDELMAMLEKVGNVYYTALFGKYSDSTN